MIILLLELYQVIYQYTVFKLLVFIVMCVFVIHTNPKGVDPDLYDLAIIKLETIANSCHLEDALNHLMSTAVRTRTSIRSAQLLHPCTYIIQNI